uniref:C-type lectin domain-containing protein n=2 Tax=Iconisemion striatum TaxID=60296 RepID=A0A1A7X271_9TELE
MQDYVNEEPRQREEINKGTDRRAYYLMFLLFGVLCITQVILNVALRLAIHCDNKSVISGCNITQLIGEITKEEAKIICEKVKLAQYKTLQERVIALQTDLKTLEDRNRQQFDAIKKVEEERDRLMLKVNELNGCVSSQRCPSGWREINSRCYFLSTETKAWEESRQKCQSVGADLVVINNEQEQNALYRMNGNQYLLFWIGLHNTDGTLKWVDGSELNDTFWQNGQPSSDVANNEDCVEMYHQSPALANWNDAPCQNSRHWLCEKDLCFKL